MKVDNKFVKEFDSMIRKTLLRTGIYKHNIEDVLPLVYERIIKHDNYDSEKGPLKGWIWMVTQSTARNVMVTKGRSKDVLDQQTLGLEEVKHVFSDSNVDVEIELRDILRKAPISPRDKRLIKLVHLNGYTHKEAGKIEGISKEAASIALFRAMKALKDSNNLR
jgi:RNA polymerase sigma factor (sigma-70 family)